MSQSMGSLTEHQLVAVGRPALRALRAAVLRDGPEDAAALRDAGYAGGERLWIAFASFTQERAGTPVESLALGDFQRAASDFFTSIGWGTLEIITVSDAVVAVDTTDWWEADPDDQGEEPGCHFTTGLLAYFFGRVADAAVAVLEVECRSTGAPRCRYLVGSPDVLRYVFDELERGEGYLDAVARTE